MQRQPWVLTFAFTLVACGGGPTNIDAGTDAGTGGGGNIDGGGSSVGVDGGNAADSGSPADSGTPADNDGGLQSPDSGTAGADAGGADGGQGSFDGGDNSPDGGPLSDAGALFCAPRPFGDDDITLDHFTHPTVYGVAGNLTVVSDESSPNSEYPDDSSGTHHVVVYRPSGDATYPVLFYSHAFGGEDPHHVEEMFKRIASNGFNIVFVPYPETGRIKQYTILWNGFLTAVNAYGAKFDLHEGRLFRPLLGGGASPEMARRAFGAQRKTA